MSDGEPKCSCPEDDVPWHNDPQCPVKASELPASICYVAFVQWEYEDKLPADINRPHFDAMFELSKVDGVRLYPFIQWNGQRIYLGAT